MTNINLESYFYLKSPLHHGSEQTVLKPIGLPEKAGNNYTPHKTEQEIMLYPNYAKQVRIPIVSGNSIRNKIRNLLVAPTLDAIDVDFSELSKNMRDIFTSGGGMDKQEGDKNEKEKDKTKNEKVPLLIRDQETLRAAFPMLSLFGASYGNRMLSGQLKVGIAKPIFIENQHLFDGRKGNIHYTDDILYYQMATRAEVNRDAMKDGDISKQNIYYYEVASSGLEFRHRIIGENLSDIELSALQLALDLFKEKAYLGGKTSTGYGYITTDEWYQDTGVSSDLYLNWLNENKVVISEYLSYWDNPKKLMKDEKTIKWDEKLTTKLDELISERRSNIKEKLPYL